MENWTYADWLKHQKQVIREEARETIEKESDKKSPVLKREIMRIQMAS